MYIFPLYKKYYRRQYPIIIVFVPKLVGDFSTGICGGVEDIHASVYAGFQGFCSKPTNNGLTLIIVFVT
jgi:hypothetical protein